MTARTTACPACGLDLDVASASLMADDVVCPACGHGLWYRVEPIGDVHVVHLKGQGIVTEQNVMRVLERVRNLMNERSWDRVLLNFEGVTYVSSTVLARLINLERLSIDHRAQLKLCGLRPEVQDIFRITHLESSFEMHPDQAEALGAFLRGTAIDEYHDV